jgi:predicted phage tail component-like protein
MITFIDENGVTKTPNDFSLAVLPNHEHEAIPETNDRTLSIPEKDGLLYYGSNLGAREFNIPFIVIPQENRIEMQKRIRGFSNFIFNQYGKPKILKIIFDYEPDKYYHVRFSGRLSPERYYRMAQFDLPLIAYDPFAYSEMDTYNQEGLYYDAGLTYNDHSTSLISWDSVFDNALIYPNPISFEWGNTRHYSGVYNHSQTSTPLIATIEGGVKRPSIRNLTNGQIMMFDLELEDGQVLKIEGDKLTVKLQKNGTETDIFYKVTGDFIQLVNGENEIQFRGESPNATVTYRWKHKFV